MLKATTSRNVPAKIAIARFVPAKIVIAVLPANVVVKRRLVSNRKNSRSVRVAVYKKV